MMGMWFAVGFIVIALFLGVAIYNGLIARKNQVDNADSTIVVMLKKRFDLLPNMVETVKAYMSHEREVLNELTELRTRFQSDMATREKKSELDRRLNQVFSRFNIMVEAYPDLKASNNFSQLQRSINETEEQIAAARRAYNAAVTDLNNGIEMFPSNIFARRMGLTQRILFDIPEAQTQLPDIAELFENRANKDAR
ncbi:LemA family protein [Photobacterium salinisoli]|uniref:LemA family protein n=1 Tax=Photobacterium salinisoli TaxID=1616783 RepID=UPI001F096CAE|nr:LemA family protein [Photobacterium salinisoli]